MPQIIKNAQNLIKCLKLHNVEKKYTGVLFLTVFCVPSLSLAQKTLKKKLEQNCFENVVSEFWKKNA